MIVSDHQLARLSGASGAFGAYGDIVADAAAVQALVRDPSGLIRRVLIQSEWTPDIGVDYPLRPAAPGASPAAAVRFLRPKVTLDLAPPFRPYTIAPGGEPGRNKWALAKVGVVVVALLAGKGAWDLIRGR